MSMTRRTAWIVPGLVVALGGLMAPAGASPRGKASKAEAAVESGSKGHGCRGRHL